MVSRLVARESSAASDPNAAAVTAGVLQRMAADLVRFIGKDACHALLVRARVNAEADHPALKDIQIVAQPDLAVGGVLESIQLHGAAETAAGLESTVVSLIELLGKLIGNDLAMKLVDQNPSDGALPDGPRLLNDE